jgi:hypothetical protein
LPSQHLARRAKADGTSNGLRVQRWKARRCTSDPEQFVRGNSAFAPPFEHSRPGFFTDTAIYSDSDESVVLRFNMRASGRRVSKRRWRGDFRANVTVRNEGGIVLDRCTLRTRWTATRT